MAKVFLDTNVLVYAADNHDPVRRDKARAAIRRVVETENPVISTQVLQEFYSAAVGKLKIDPLLAKEILHGFHNMETVQIDLGLIEGRADDPEVEVEPWVEDELVPFCAPTHPLAGHKTVSLDELTPEWWILRERGSGTRETLERALRHRPEGLRVRLELEHTEAVKRAVENGLGIGCISRLALRDAFRRGSLVPLEVPGLDLSRRFQFAWHRGKYHTAAIRAFLAACRRMTAGARRSHEIALPPVK